METLRPIIGMALVGGLVGWVLGRACIRAARVVFLVILAVIALELIGYHVATMHWDAISGNAAAAADAARAYGSVAWRLALYNIPFTAGLLLGLWKAMPPRKSRK
jgi:uncharacterized membrane protein (Fun14 family)